MVDQLRPSGFNLEAIHASFVSSNLEPIFEKVLKMDTPSVARELRGLLGDRLVAYITGVSHTRTVQKWAAGEQNPLPLKQQKLKVALITASHLAEKYDAHLAQSWMQGLNPGFDDRSAATMLRNGDLSQVSPQILEEALSFE